jgi:SAM-dependent methyltransferase
VDPDQLVGDVELHSSDVVANATMNRQRGLEGANSYTKDLGFNPLAYLLDAAGGRDRKVAWLDACCGSGRALHDAADRLLTLRTNGDVALVGVDLVDYFDPRPDLYGRVTLVAAPLLDWTPTGIFDLITCVHGLHYLGDKLGALRRLATWLTTDGLLVADFDPASIRLADGQPGGRALTRLLRQAGFELDTRRHRVRLAGHRRFDLPFTYIGADDTAGPNYTGQPAVNSYYRLS